MAASPYLVKTTTTVTYGGSAGRPPCSETVVKGMVVDATAAMLTAIGAVRSRR